MQDAWAVLRFARDRRTIAVFAGLAFFAAGQLVSGAIQRWERLREEAVWLRARLADKAELRLSLGKMTWTHEMARVLLLEQIYRALCIARNIPYHK